jgi:hypothetical protein
MWLRECREAGQQVQKLCYIKKNTRKKNLKDSYSLETLLCRPKYAAVYVKSLEAVYKKSRTMVIQKYLHKIAAMKLPTNSEVLAEIFCITLIFF